MTPPPTKPDPNAPTQPPDERPDGSVIEELNRQTLPKTPDGKVVDPNQEEAKDSAG